MALGFIAKDPESKEDHCPSVWVDEETSDIVVQGWWADAATVEECKRVGSIPDTEGVVRLPARMVEALRRACDVADGSAVR
ncbi:MULTISPECIES: hypothetical protein [Streptomyces]|uniref:hypothetical protein n=1 Tax=Streptomyces TaxID=1883 RepID=UPI0022494006|nr:hypothetical protein [Streptomyces sp. JHD 1]MCX2967840.1 hypothetical protein [Streptomyces sp. JHD 1]